MIMFSWMEDSHTHTRPATPSADPTPALDDEPSPSSHEASGQTHQDTF